MKKPNTVAMLLSRFSVVMVGNAVPDGPGLESWLCPETAG